MGSSKIEKLLMSTQRQNEKGLENLCQNKKKLPTQKSRKETTRRILFSILLKLK